MSSPQTILWIDHREARIFGIEPGTLDNATIRAPGHHVHRHPAGGTAEHNHPGDERAFFQEVAHALEGAEQILIVGPSTAKVQFFRYLHQHAPKLEPKVVSIETVDHPTDGQLVAYAKRHFGIPARIQ